MSLSPQDGQSQGLCFLQEIIALLRAVGLPRAGVRAVLPCMGSLSSKSALCPALLETGDVSWVPERLLRGRDVEGSDNSALFPLWGLCPRERETGALGSGSRK